jgi:hypothetical protein
MAKNGTKISAETSKQAPSLTANLAVLWQTFHRDVRDPYRPELHYMRGPGPKWRAKHSPHSVDAADAAPDLAHAATA